MIAIATLAMGLAAPAAGAPAADPSDPADLTAGSDAQKARPGAEPEPLTPQEVKAQLAQAEKLRTQLAGADKEIAAATAELSELAAKSGAAMDAVSRARAAEKAARTKERQQLARLKKLTAQAAQAKRDVDAMAYDAYVNGSSSLRDVAAIVELSQRGNDAALIDYLAKNRFAEGKRYAALATAQRQAAQEAGAARRQREAATARAEAAQRQVQRSVAAQQAALIALQKRAAGRRAELDKLGVDTTGMSGVDVTALTTMTSAPLCTQDTGDYANGMFPATALCAVRGFPGHMMRPAAARALNALATAYRKDTGTNLCVTDTYRSYAAQVDVKGRKPTLAATPGTSNHGLGLAVDLCGGIDSFGTLQHQWMQQHAPLFGFYHPSWAQPGGSKPEPWHWEFAQ